MGGGRSRRGVPPGEGPASGLRVARWLRESTAGQLDFYGPAAQTRVIEDAIERLGFADTGIGWTVAASGWTRAWLTPEWQEMLAAARLGRFDLLLVAYQSRFLRDVKQTLIAIEDELHPAGVAVYFIDERLLSSDPRRLARHRRGGHGCRAVQPPDGEAATRRPCGQAPDRRAGWATSVWLHSLRNTAGSR